MEEPLHGLRNSHSVRLVNEMKREVNLAAVEWSSERCTGTPGAIVVGDKCHASCRSVQSTGL